MEIDADMQRDTISMIILFVFWDSLFMLRIDRNASGSVSESLFTQSNFVAYIFIDFCVFIMRDWDWDWDWGWGWGLRWGLRWCLLVWSQFD